MPLPDAAQNSWRSSAPALRWAKPAIRRFDWELWPGACGQLTTPPACGIDALAYRNERGRQDRHLCPLFPSFERGQASARRRQCKALAADITSERKLLEHPPQCQVHKKLDSHARRQRPARRQPPSFRMDRLWVDCLSFWTAPRRPIAALEGPVGFRVSRTELHTGLVRYIG